MATPLFAIGLVIIATLLGAYGALALKQGANKLTRKDYWTFLNKHIILGVIFYGLSTVFFLIGLKFGQLSVLYPFTSLSYVWICFLSIKFLDEGMNSLKWLGIGAILLGVTLIGFGS